MAVCPPNTERIEYSSKQVRRHSLVTSLICEPGSIRCSNTAVRHKREEGKKVWVRAEVGVNVGVQASYASEKICSM